MPFMMFCMLGALVKLGGRGRNGDVATESGYPVTSITRMLQTGRRRGWIETRSGTNHITEAGKIVFAIESGRQTKAAYLGRRYKALTYKDFSGATDAERREQEGRAQRQREAAGRDGDAERGDARCGEAGHPAT